ncbi:acetyl-coenzyme A synthetase N-terminal domain-containing protein, partial [Intrasporangium sp.]|uniref:acetyl-coenzyme A synthetase N-terminal domain-containing protein n=1 Tax=Intrasporangium sp. TaxID=1925024 RepID=UPI0033653A01
MSETLENLLQETRTFPPPPEFAARANGAAALYEQADAAFEGFWAEQARTYVKWSKDFTQVLQWDAPFAKWYADGELNACYNAVDRHVEAGNGDRVAIHWVGEPENDTRDLT